MATKIFRHILFGISYEGQIIALGEQLFCFGGWQKCAWAAGPPPTTPQITPLRAWSQHG